MPINFFGQYLVAKGIITAETLAKAVGMQESVNRNFGQTAQLVGLLTSEEVSRISRAQRTQDMLFGDMAVKLGLLSADQVARILALQKHNHLYIGEALVRIGALDREHLETFLEEFKRERASFTTTGLELPDEIPWPDFCLIVGDVSHKILSRIALLTFKPGECELVNRIEGNSIAVAIDFAGDITARYYITFPLFVRKKIAIAMISDDHVPSDTAMCANKSINETIVSFVTIIGDNIISRAAAAGIRIVTINSEIIDHDDDIMLPAATTALLFPVYFPTGEWIDIALILPA
jgi:hypothetical protein